MRDIIVLVRSDIVERAYMISRNKAAFFEREALAEANRYVAALFTAVAYDQPECVRLMLAIVGRREATRNCFDTVSKEGPVAVTRTLSVGELAHTLGEIIVTFVCGLNTPVKC
jgi:hypothetical protein